MRKLNMTNYTVKFKTPDRLVPGKLIESELPFQVKDSILNLLFIQDLQLTGAELVKQNVLAMKLESCKEDEILLEDEEWGRIKRAVDTFKGFDRNAVELVTRITNAEVVEVETK